MPYLLIADLLLIVHVLVVAFIVGGQAFILLGSWIGWPGVRNPWFRYSHLGAMGIVALQAWLGQICPLTVWEQALREKAGTATYPGGFIAHWLEALLYYQAPAWVFMLIYSLFFALVVASWYWVRPR